MHEILVEIIRNSSTISTDLKAETRGIEYRRCKLLWLHHGGQSEGVCWANGERTTRCVAWI